MASMTATELASGLHQVGEPVSRRAGLSIVLVTMGGGHRQPDGACARRGVLRPQCQGRHDLRRQIRGQSLGHPRHQPDRAKQRRPH